MGFWANVEREREYQGLSRKELAFKANIAYQGIGLGLERNSMPGADTAVKISKVLQVPIEYLIGEDFIDTRDAETAKATDDELKIKNIEMYKGTSKNSHHFQTNSNMLKFQHEERTRIF